MMDQLIAIKDKLLAFWNKYTTKQKTIIICVALAVFFAVVVLSYVLTRPVYTHLASFSDASLASTLSESLDGEGITYKMETDPGTGITTFDVEQSKYSDAVLVMGANGIVDKEMSWDDALKSDMTTSSLEKQTKITLALQSSIKENLLKFDGVEDATVIINRQEDDKKFISATKETSVSVSLKLADGKELPTETATAMAYYLTNAVGNKTTDNIVIVDTKGNLYGAKTDNTLGGTISGAEDYKAKLQQTFSERTEKMLLKAGYDDADCSKTNIKFNMDKVTELVTTYSVAEGQDQGYYSSSYEYSSTGQSGSGGPPGTDSNSEETDYMIQDGGSSNTQTVLNKYNYLPNEDVKNIEHEVGAVVPEESSMGVVLTKYRKISEESLERDGALDNISFEEYAEQNSAPTTLEVPDEIKQLIAAATGIAENNITIIAQEQPVFEAAEDTGFAGGLTNYLMIILAVLIGALLIFVIIRGTSPVEVTETEPELSVEDLLATTKEEEENLEEIELSEKSETRKLIEKFVDENPEAVAMLLRNWINEDWG